MTIVDTQAGSDERVNDGGKYKNILLDKFKKYLWLVFCWFGLIVGVCVCACLLARVRAYVRACVRTCVCVRE